MSAIRVVSLVAAFVACSPAASEVPEQPATSSSSEVTPTAEASAAASASAEVVPSAAADTRVKDACAKLCERVTSSCAKGRGEKCAVQCAGHEAKSKGCESETEAALMCQVKASEAFCDSVASAGCSDAFLRMQRCQRGEAPSARPTGDQVPAGWERIKDDTWGVSMVMPKGAALDGKAKSRTWTASFEGATYEVVELPRPAKLEQHALIKLVLAHVGTSCQKEMKLTGRVDRDALTFFRFETSCGAGGAGERLHGAVRIDEKRAVSMVVRGGPKSEAREAFLGSMR